jgi:nitrous oxidase accessory protein NosD
LSNSPDRCKTIGHAISLASSGDSIIVAAATYTENLIIGISLNVIGSGANTTIIDGGGHGRVVTILTIPNHSTVTLSDVTIEARRHGG